MKQVALNFDLDQALDARDEGIKQVEDSNPRFLRVAREVAKSIARVKGEVTADDVRKKCPLDPLHPNAWGGLFRTKDFEYTGRERVSKLVQGHGNKQKIWRLREATL